METKAHAEVGGTRPKAQLQSVNLLRHLGQALVSEAGHDRGMVLSWFWKSCHGHITITDSLDLEDIFSEGEPY